MKTLITGANGYIGTHLANFLLDRGYSVNAFVEQGTNTQLLEALPVNIFRGDIRSPESIGPAIEGCDTVFHLASVVGLWAKDPNIFHEVNVKGTDKLLETCLRNGVNRVVVVSSCGAFGLPKSGQMLDETVENGHLLTDPYEVSKYKQVEVSKKYLKYGLEVVFVYLSRVFGPGIKSSGNSITEIFDGMLKGTWKIIPGDGKTVANYAFVHDVVNGLVQAMEHGENGEKYILGGENLDYDQLFYHVENITGRHFTLRRIPYPVMWLAGMVAEFRATLTGGKPFVTRFGAKKFTTNCPISCQKAKEQLGYRVTPIYEALRYTLDQIERGIQAPKAVDMALEEV